MFLNTFIMLQVIRHRQARTNGRHLEVHTILDVCDFWRRISGGRIVGMECLFSQNQMGCVDSDTVRRLWRIHRSRQWNHRW